MSVLHLHAGTAKSGTTWLQRVLAHNRKRLRDAGVLYPRAGQSHYLASLDLRGDERAGEYARARGAWSALAAETRSHRGPVVISHESLAQLDRAGVARLVADVAPHEVRVVLTVRDVGRQLPAVWQERVKNRSRQGWDRFLAQVERGWRDGDPDPEAAFWRTQDLARLVDGFGDLPVTVVTVPPPGGDRAELWRRFAVALDLPDLEPDLDVGPGNASMGRTETDVLRLVNRGLPDDVSWRRYEHRIKNGLVRERLAGRAQDGPIVVPPELRPRVRDYAERTRAAVTDPRVRLVGDPADLEPRYPDEGGREPDPDRVRDLAVRLVADLLVDRK